MVVSSSGCAVDHEYSTVQVQKKRITTTTKQQDQDQDQDDRREEEQNIVDDCHRRCCYLCHHDEYPHKNDDFLVGDNCLAGAPRDHAGVVVSDDVDADADDAEGADTEMFPHTTLSVLLPSPMLRYWSDNSAAAAADDDEDDHNSDAVAVAVVSGAATRRPRTWIPTHRRGTGWAAAPNCYYYHRCCDFYY